ncbi:MAG: RsiV family protein [Muribaculaceae bacterium]|nr:RsiV family protein [Muribaculaceae bacterium]
MKSRNLLSIAFAAACLAGAVGCSERSDTGNETLAFRQTQVTEAFRLLGSAEAYQSDSDMVIACRADLLLPVDLLGQNASALQDTILSRLLGTTVTDPERRQAEIGDYFRKYASEEGYGIEDVPVADADSADFFTRYNGYVSVTADPLNVSPDLLVYRLVAAYYTPGAAHGMYSTAYVNYDLATGKVLELADLVCPEGLDRLPAILKDRAKVLQPVIGPTSLSALPGGDNYYISTDNELVFAYQPYEIASYAQGEVKISVQPYLLYDYLTPLGRQVLLR